MIIIGSRAMAHQMNNPHRINFQTDYDVIMTIEEFMQWQKDNQSYIVMMIPRSENKYKVVVRKGIAQVQYEVELGFEGTSSKLLLDNKNKVCNGKLTGFFGEEMNVLNLQYQMLTKRSHLIYPIHFEKNIEDYHSMKRFLGDFEKDELMQEYYTLRSKETAERIKQRTPKLNVSVEDFFSSKLPVPIYFVHDHIHEMMAHYDRPLYTMIQRDPNKAWCDKDLFFDLPYIKQVQCVQEEAYVIALERYIIPQYGENCNDYFDCYKRAVKRICTTLTSGWFRDFAIENYYKVIEWYNPRFVNNFLKKVITDEIKPKDEWDINEVPLIKSRGIRL
jgi:hypothetical protein